MPASRQKTPQKNNESTKTASPTKMSLRTKTPQKQESENVLKEAKEKKSEKKPFEEVIEEELELKTPRKRAQECNETFSEEVCQSSQKKRAIRKKATTLIQRNERIESKRSEENVECKERVECKESNESVECQPKESVECQKSTHFQIEEQKGKNSRKKVKIPELSVEEQEPIESFSTENGTCLGVFASESFQQQHSAESKENLSSEEIIEKNNEILLNANASISNERIANESISTTSIPNESIANYSISNKSIPNTKISNQSLSASCQSKTLPILREPLVRDSVSSAIAFLYQRGFLKGENSSLSNQHQIPTFEIQHLDSKGNKLAPKEAFKQLSDRFHGYSTK